MPTLVIIASLFVLFFLLEIFYFKIAERYNIVDKPNSRSSHSVLTIRGGGILFSASVFIFIGFNQFPYIYFALGLLMIALISFLDDILTLNSRVRFTVHIVSAGLIYYQWDAISLPLIIYPFIIFLIVGIINAYNFMDGINGITGIYSLFTVATLYYINEAVITFAVSDLFIYLMISLVVFLYFNLRKAAKCFAGDVGSVCVAFIIVFLIGNLIIRSENFIYIFFLLLYGLDAASTIFFRLLRGENIFEPHRSHFYQFLVNERKFSHIIVSVGYGLMQLLINVIIVIFTRDSIIVTLGFVVVISVIFVIVRFTLEGRQRLILGTFIKK